MESKSSNIEIIDKFIENEHKSRLWTILSVSLFLLMAVLVLFLTRRLNKTESDRDKAYTQVDSLNSILKANDTLLKKYNAEWERKCDSLQKALNLMAELFNKSQEQYYHNDSTAAKANLVQISTQLFPHKDLKEMEIIRNAVLRPKAVQNTKGDFLLFVQFMPEYGDQAAKTISLFRSKGYRLQPSQPIRNLSFNSVVKYFSDDDKADALKILSLINNSDPFFSSHPATLEKLDIKSPYQQVEVWIGKYEETDPGSVLQNIKTNRFIKGN